MVSCRQTDDAVDDARHHGFAVELQVALARVLSGEHFVTSAHHERASQHVTRLRGTDHIDQLRMAAPHIRDRLVDGFVGDVGRRLLHANRVVIAQIHIRPHGDRRSQGERMLALEGVDVDLRLGDRHHACLVQRAAVQLGDQMVDRVLANRLPPQGALHHWGRRLAGTKPRDANARGETPERRLDGGVHLVGRRFDAHLDEGARFAGDVDGELRDRHAISTQ